MRWLPFAGRRGAASSMPGFAEPTLAAPGFAASGFPASGFATGGLPTRPAASPGRPAPAPPPQGDFARNLPAPSPLAPSQLAPGSVPAGRRVYAIGDIHGCAGQLATLHAVIAEDAARHPPARITLVHLGDYVDRGPDSAGVLHRLLDPPPIPGAEVVNLLGNHEVMLLDACDPQAHPGAMPFWLENGGAATLASYGADPAARDAWEAIPGDHLEMLRHCPLSFAAGDYLFVHAGVRPGIPIDRQDPFDLVWIREPFLSFEGDLPQVVVHGHTPAELPAIRSHRIGIDTGACFGGPLTCLVLEGHRLRFLAA